MTTNHDFKVRVIFQASELTRRAVAHREGRHGRLATKDEMRDHFDQCGYSVLDDLIWEMGQCDEGCQS